MTTETAVFQPFEREKVRVDDIVDQPTAADSTLIHNVSNLMAKTWSNEKPPGKFDPPASADSARSITLYPHLYDKDSSSTAALAMEQIGLAITDTERAISAYNSGNLSEVWVALGGIGDCLSRAHQHTEFNEAFGSVVTFAHRAIRSADVNEINESHLMALQSALVRLTEEPTMTLSEAADVADQLESSGWQGSDEDVAAFAKGLLEYFGFSTPNQHPLDSTNQQELSL